MPLPSRKNHKSITISHDRTRGIIEKCFNDVLNWSYFRCGTFLNFGADQAMGAIPMTWQGIEADKAFSNPDQSGDNANVSIRNAIAQATAEQENEVYEVIREQALMKHLEVYVNKQEEKWRDYDDDEIEVMLEISEMVFEALLDDSIYSLC